MTFSACRRRLLASSRVYSDTSDHRASQSQLSVGDMQDQADHRSHQRTSCAVPGVGALQHSTFLPHRRSGHRVAVAVYTALAHIVALVLLR